MNTATIICSLLMFATFSIAADVTGAGCSVTATIAIRTSASWSDGTNTNQIYDITVSNNGVCPVDNVGLQFGLPSGSVISDKWNLMADDLYYLLENFGTSMAVGSMYNAAGIVVSTPTGSAVTTPVTIQVYGSACPRECMNSASSSSAPVDSSSAPAPVDSSSAPAPVDSSSAPAPVDSSSSAPTTGTCSVSSVIVRDTTTATWTDSQGKINAVYRLIVTNNGECPLKDYTISFGLYDVVSMWNLQSSLGGYAVTGFGESLPAGASFSGAGLILAGASSDTIAVYAYGSNCVPCSA